MEQVVGIFLLAIIDTWTHIRQRNQYWASQAVKRQKRKYQQHQAKVHQTQFIEQYKKWYN